MTVPAASGSTRRGMALAVAGCLAGAGAALLAAREEWAVEATPRQPPLSPLRASFSGADLVPWLPALALVALAAGAALLATRHRGRLLVAGIATGCGLAIAIGAGYGLLVAPEAGRVVVSAGLWPLICLVAGLLVAAAGLLGVRHGRTWPSMGARYDRGQSASDAAASPRTDDPARLWDALDAGSDPTRRSPER